MSNRLPAIPTAHVVLPPINHVAVELSSYGRIQLLHTNADGSGHHILLTPGGARMLAQELIHFAALIDGDPDTGAPIAGGAAP